MDDIVDVNEYPRDTFFDKYFEYLGYPHNTEASITCHRWCAISILGALLGRQFYLDMGILGNYIPNQYIQIIGEPASRKSTAIKIAVKLLSAWGYTSFSPQTTSKNQFLIDLHELTWGEDDTSHEQVGEFDINKNLFGCDNPRETAASLEIAELYVANDEFTDFIGKNNYDFISLLGTLWDYDGVYTQRLKKGSVYINNPTINIIAGNTHDGFNAAFPPEIAGQGFTTRLILIYAEDTKHRVSRPQSPSKELLADILKLMCSIKKHCIGSAPLTKEAEALYSELYVSWKPLADIRFSKYSGRRFTHMLKLALICAAARVSREVHSCDIIMANTLLTFAEYNMPTAMGHFGKGKNSTIIHKILTHIHAAEKPVTIAEIMKLVHADVDKLSAVNDFISELLATNKIQSVRTATGEGGLLPVKAVKVTKDSDILKPSWLLDGEKLIHSL